MNEQKRVAMVTGAASGIGKEVAKTLADDGFIVICADISEKTNQLPRKFQLEGVLPNPLSWMWPMKKL